MKAEAVGARGARGILSSDALASYEAEVFSTSLPPLLPSLPLLLIFMNRPRSPLQPL
jgi:hypothetical protein